MAQAEELEKELKSDDPDPCCARLQHLQLELNKSHVAALDEWNARGNGEWKSTPDDLPKATVDLVTCFKPMLLVVSAVEGTNKFWISSNESKWLIIF